VRRTESLAGCNGEPTEVDERSSMQWGRPGNAPLLTVFSKLFVCRCVCDVSQTGASIEWEHGGQRVSLGRVRVN
jgi:hypothetical protein